jgi:hypothetical protein
MVTFLREGSGRRMTGSKVLAIALSFQASRHAMVGEMRTNEL